MRGAESCDDVPWGGVLLTAVIQGSAAEYLYASDASCNGPYGWHVKAPACGQGGLAAVVSPALYRLNARPTLCGDPCPAWLAAVPHPYKPAFGPASAPAAVSIAMSGKLVPVLPYLAGRALLEANHCALHLDQSSYYLPVVGWHANVFCAVGKAAELACGDGTDNDGDGIADCADPDCAGVLGLNGGYCAVLP